MRVIYNAAVAKPAMFDLLRHGCIQLPSVAKHVGDKTVGRFLAAHH